MLHSLSSAQSMLCFHAWSVDSPDESQKLHMNDSLPVYNTANMHLGQAAKNQEPESIDSE